MTLRITRKLFPFLPEDPSLRITQLVVLLETKESSGCGAPDIGGCRSPHEELRGSHLVEVTVDRPDDDRDDFAEVEISCVRSADYPGLYHGVGKVRVGPIDSCHDCHSMTLTFD